MGYDGEVFFIEGFEIGGNPLRRFDEYQGEPDGLVGGRNGGTAARWNLEHGYGRVLNPNGPGGAFALGFAARHDGNFVSRGVKLLDAASDDVADFSWGGSSDEVTLTVGSDEHTAFGDFADWEYWELVIRPGETDGLEWYRDGQLEVAMDCPSDVSAVQFGRNTGLATRRIDIDDIYAKTGTDRLGDSYVVGALPDAAGEHTEWTPSATGDNYEMVNDAEDPDDEYVEATGEAIDQYGVTPGISSDWVIRAVSVDVRAILPEGGVDADVYPRLRVGGTDYEGDARNLGAAYREARHLWEQNPDTGQPWEPGELDQIEIGQRVEFAGS